MASTVQCFAHKYRRNKVFIEEILRQLCKWQLLQIIEGSCTHNTNVGWHTAKKENLGIYGISQRKNNTLLIFQK